MTDCSNCGKILIEIDSEFIVCGDDEFGDYSYEKISCMNCGKEIHHKDGLIAGLLFDTGDPGDRMNPPVDAEYSLLCIDCLKEKLKED